MYTILKNAKPWLDTIYLGEGEPGQCVYGDYPEDG